MKQYVLMSDEELGELEHFGVRGMKWGVRNPHKSYGQHSRAKARAVGKALRAPARAVGRAVSWKPIKSAGKKVWSGSKGLRKKASKSAARGAKKAGKKTVRMAKQSKKAVVKKWNGMSKTRKAVLTTAVAGLALDLALRGGSRAATAAGSAVVNRGMENAFNRPIYQFMGGRYRY